MQKHELNTILKAAAANHPISQEKLYKHYFALMYSICKSYSDDRQTILSIINEGFLKIFMNLNSFDAEKASFETWAKKIMTNNCIDYSRQRQREADFSNLDDTPETHLLKAHEDSYMQEEVLHLLQKLPKMTQKVFSLYVFKGYSHREIGKALNMAESTSRWHVQEGRKSLKQQAHKIY